MTAAVGDRHPGQGTAPGASLRARTTRWLGLIAFGLIGLAVRTPLLIVEHGPVSTAGYDDGVYVAASALLTDGVVAYRDYVFLHPPGIMVFLSPLASFAPNVSDLLVAARWLTAFVGAVNVVLVALLAFRWKGWVAGAVAGLLYATYGPAVKIESGVVLEPYVNLCVLAGALCWFVEKRRPRHSAAAGALIGLAAVTKLIGGLALIALLVSEPLRGPWRHRITAAGAAALAGLVVLAPFVALAGVGRVWDLLVVTQLRRPGHDEAGASIDGVVDRLEHLGSYGPFPLSRVPELGLLGALVAAVVVVWAWRREGPIGRFLAASIVLGSVAILSAPDYYDQYPVIAFAAIAIALGGAVEASLDALARVHPQARLVAAGGAVALLAIGGVHTVRGVQERVDGAPRSDSGALVASRTGSKCITGDFPEQLLAADRLPPESSAGERLVDPFGELIHEGLRDGDHATTAAAIHSPGAQDRLQQALDACSYAVTYGLLEEPPPWWSEATRTWFLERYEPSLETEAGTVLWRRQG